MPPKLKLPDVEFPSVRKRICGANKCGMEMRSCDLARHYQNKTNFNALNKLKLMSSDAGHAAAKELEKTDSHTAYMFINKHSTYNLPKWNTHKPAKKPIPSIFKDVN